MSRAAVLGCAVLVVSCGSAAPKAPGVAPPEEADDAAPPAAPSEPEPPGNPDARAPVARPDAATVAADAAPLARDAGPLPDVSLPGGWTPARVQGLAFWLSAGEGVTATAGKVSAWKDLSPNHNDAAQARATLQPALVEGVANGRPVVRFTQRPGTNLAIADAPSLQWGTGDFTVAVVFSHTNQPVAGSHLGGWGMFLNKIMQPPGTGRTGWGIMANWPNGENNPVNTWIGGETKEAGGLLSKKTGYNDGKLRLWAMRRVTAQRVVELRRNGTLDNRTVGNTFMNDVDNKGMPVTLGGMRSTPTAGAGFNFNGDIAEVVAVGGTISDADLALLEAYLVTKYALSD